MICDICQAGKSKAGNRVGGISIVQIRGVVLVGFDIIVALSVKIQVTLLAGGGLDTDLG